MKTTIEVEGYEITIDTTAEAISVCAMKDDDIVEEFTLALGEGDESQDLPEGDDEVQGFDEFSEEEGDFEEAEGDLEDAEEDLEDAEDDIEDAEEDVEDAEEKVEDAEEESKLESFQSFFNKRKKK